jgi:hypothetical protein
MPPHQIEGTKHPFTPRIDRQRTIFGISDPEITGLILNHNVRYSSQYSARLSAHPNDLTVNLIELPDNRRLRRHLPNDLCLPDS